MDDTKHCFISGEPIFGHLFGVIEVFTIKDKRMIHENKYYRDEYDKTLFAKAHHCRKCEKIVTTPPYNTLKNKRTELCICHECLHVVEQLETGNLHVKTS
jgi:hypothetical protein